MKRLPLILSFATAAVCAYARTTDNASPVSLQPNEQISIDCLHDNPVVSQMIEAGVTLPKGKGRWQIVADGYNGDVLKMTVETKEKNFGDFDHDRIIVITALSADTVISSAETNRNISKRQSANFLRLETNGKTVTVSVGNHRLEKVMNFHWNGFFDSATVTSDKNPIEIVRRTVSTVPDLSAEPFIAPDELMAIADSCDDANAGIWKYLDEETDRDFARRGGEYILAILPDADAYTIVYIGGTRIYPDRWHSGMTKGRLSPSLLPGNYDLQWTGADFSTDFEGANAFFENDILTLVFPVDRAKMRFARVR